jgi:hypothetical protein
MTLCALPVLRFQFSLSKILILGSHSFHLHMLIGRDSEFFLKIILHQITIDFNRILPTPPHLSVSAQVHLLHQYAMFQWWWGLVVSSF